MDIAKGIGIMLVVYGHVARGVVEAGLHYDSRIFHSIDSVIYSFHMPLFFFLSGLFFYDSLKKRGEFRFLGNRVDAIVYPYVIWSILQGMLEVTFSDYTNGNVKIGEVLSLFWKPRAQFWFLYALFAVNIFCLVFCKALPRRLYPVLLLVCLGMYFLQGLVVGITPLLFVFHYSVFFVAGMCFNHTTYDDLIKSHGWKLLIPGALFIALAQYSYLNLGGADEHVKTLLEIVVAGISITFVLLVSKVLSNMTIHWLTYLGQYSMVIYLMHVIAGSGMRVILQRVMDIEDISVHLIAGCLAGVLLPIAVHRLSAHFRSGFLFSPPRFLSME